MNKGHDKGHRSQMSDRDAMNLALEALDQYIEKELTFGQRYTNEGQKLLDAHAALRQALEQPEQEPVAWVKVSDSLPKSGVIVLAFYKNRLGNPRRIRAQWIAANTETSSVDYGECYEYDEETDEYYLPEGWYECMDNWHEYSSVAVCEGEITHWMPLPPAPDEAINNEKCFLYSTLEQPKREWVGLTDEDRYKAIRPLYNSDENARLAVEHSNDEYEAIEAKLKEKNA